MSSVLCSSYCISRKISREKLSQKFCHFVAIHVAKVVFFTNSRKFSLSKVSSYTVCQYVSLLHILWMVSIMMFSHCMHLTMHSVSVAHCHASIFLQISQYLVISDSYTDTSVQFCLVSLDIGLSVFLVIWLVLQAYPISVYTVILCSYLFQMIYLSEHL